MNITHIEFQSIINSIFLFFVNQILPVTGATESINPGTKIFPCGVTNLDKTWIKSVIGSWTTPPNNPDLISNYKQLHNDDPVRYPDSKFIDQWNKNAPMQNYNLELSGGTDKVTYHTGLGFYDQKGLFDPVGYKRYNYNMGLEMKATNTTKIGID